MSHNTATTLNSVALKKSKENICKGGGKLISSKRQAATTTGNSRQSFNSTKPLNSSRIGTNVTCSIVEPNMGVKKDNLIGKAAYLMT